MLVIASGLFWGFFPSIDNLTRLLALTGLVVVALHLSTDRSRETVLRQRSEAFLRITIDNAAAGVGVTDASGRFIRVNPAFCDILGWAPEKVDNLHWQDITHPDGLEQELALVEEILANKRDNYRIKVPVLREDGRSVWIDLSVSCSRRPSGEVEFLIGEFIDITKEVEANQQLEAERQRLSTTLDSLLDPHVLFEPVRDADGQITDLRILRANPAAAAYNHRAMEEFVGATLRQILPEVVEKGLFALYRQTWVTGEPLVLDDYEFRQHKLLGSSRHYDIRAVKVGEELSVTWRDVTERFTLKKTLEQRAAMDTALPQGLERSAELANGARHGSCWGVDQFSRQGYYGPQPPPGPVHHYRFQLSALDCRLGLAAGSTAAEVRQAMEGHVLGQAELIGLYQHGHSD